MRELRVTPIKNGTVIDHLPAGSALEVCKVLGIPREGSASTVSVVMHVPSDQMGRKDIVKVEDRDLFEEDLEQLAVLAPSATINTVREYKVQEKTKPEAPDEVTGLGDCPNPACVSNEDEPVAAEFDVIAGDNGHIELSCAFCVERIEDPLSLVG
jgi:aspartate carbamoyltransferase regulatory subunit